MNNQFLLAWRAILPSVNTGTAHRNHARRYLQQDARDLRGLPTRDQRQRPTDYYYSFGSIGIVLTFRNAEAKLGRSKYKKTLWLLPTVDHTLDAAGNQKFVICSWKVNDAKGDLSHDEFCKLCELVLKHRAQQKSALASLLPQH